MNEPQDKPEWAKKVVASQDAVENGAEALMRAFPTLREDFTDRFFRKIARIVLEAAEKEA